MGKISDKINRMIDVALNSAEITSAGGEAPRTNRVIQINERDDPDFEEDIRAVLQQPDTADTEQKKDPKKEQKIDDTLETVDDFKQGNVGELQDLTTQQMGNVSQFARNPFQFIIGSVFRRAAKGAGIVALAAVLFEVVKIIMEELFKPGRLFDTRFRERINDQILVFMERQQQQELAQGVTQVITTTRIGLRGADLRGQIGGNFFNRDRIPRNFLDTRRLEPDNKSSQNAQNRQFFDRRNSRF